MLIKLIPIKPHHTQVWEFLDPDVPKMHPPELRSPAIVDRLLQSYKFSRLEADRAKAAIMAGEEFSLKVTTG